MDMARQGDVLIIRVKKLPETVTEIERENGHIVLAHGEATGHTHAIHSRLAKFFEQPSTKRRFLEIIVPFRIGHEEHVEIMAPQIVHEEHAPIDLEAGTYEVIRQREYNPEAIRNVAD